LPDKKPESGNIMYIVAYFFTWLSGLILYLVEKDNKKMRFHAMQSILLGIVITVLSMTFILGIVGIILWFYGLYVGYKEYAGETVRIPYLADFADKYA